MKNKKILKALICLLLITTILSLGSGCAIFNFFKDEGVEFSSHTYANRADFKFNYTDKEYESFIKTISDMRSALLNPNTSEFKFSIDLTNLLLQRLRLEDSYMLANILYYADTSDEQGYERFIDIDAKYNQAMNEFSKLYEPAYRSKFKSDFFGTMTDEEIEEFIAHNQPAEQKVELNSSITDIQARYDALTREEKISSNAFNEYYPQIVTQLNELSQLNGFNDYNEESYISIYGRDYTPQDTLSFANLITDDLFETIESSITSYNSLVATLDNDLIEKCNALMETPFYSDEGKAILDGFYSSLGDEIYKIYKELINEGYYYVAHSKNAYQTAFTSYFSTVSKPFMYFSSSTPYYSSITTFVHEFGHYLNFYYTAANGQATYELMETHSQAAEWLFMTYLEELVTESSYQYIVSDKLYSDSYTLVLGSIIGAFEVEAYDKPLAEGLSYDQLLLSIKNRLYGQGTLERLYPDFLPPEQYYHLAVVSQPSYYISYSVSLISSLEIYALALDDYANAVNVYSQLVKQGSGYTESLDKVGLSSPFDKDTYQLIKQVFLNA